LLAWTKRAHTAPPERPHAILDAATWLADKDPRVMCCKRVVWALSAVWLLLGVATASAQTSDADAQTHFATGRGYFDSGDYDAAVREFERAYELSPRPSLLYDLYEAHERLGHAAKAANYLEQYLRLSELVEERDALEVRLADLKQRLESGETAHTLPAWMPSPSSGAHRSQKPARAGEPPRASERFVQAMAFFGVAGAGAVTFAVAGALALKEDQSLTRTCGHICTDHDVSGLRRRTMVADIGLGLLAVGTLVGVTLLWVERRERSRGAATLRPTVGFDSHGGSLALGGRF
jgi:tetratricopeptide (TPR) repeat protein